MRQLLSLRWMIAHLVVLAVCVGFVVLGVWQLNRLEERRTSNAVHAARFEQEPLPIEDLIIGAGSDLASLEYRRATATGTFHVPEEVLVRSQVFQGQAGFDVVTPLITSPNSGVAVNRGWVPLEFDTAPVAAAPPPTGSVTIEGVIRLSQERATLGRNDSGAGRITTVSRVDLALLNAQTESDLMPVYLEVIGEQAPTVLPVPAPPPDLADEGSHLSYAIQWFSFAVVGAVGYGFLLRRAVQRSSDGGNGQVLDDLDAGNPSEIISG